MRFDRADCPPFSGRDRFGKKEFFNSHARVCIDRGSFQYGLYILILSLLTVPGRLLPSTWAQIQLAPGRLERVNSWRGIQQLDGAG